MNLPTTITIGTILTLLMAGAMITLAHSQTSTVLPSLTSESGNQPMLSAQDVVENPSVSISIDGQPIPAKEGLSQVETPTGTAQVSVQDDSVQVSRSQSTTLDSSGGNTSLNVSVESHGSGNNFSSGSVHSSSTSVVNSGGSSSSFHSTVSNGATTWINNSN